MPYQAELEYLKNVLYQLHIQVELLRPDVVPDHHIDFGLRGFIGGEEDYRRAVEETRRWAKPNTVYKVADAFHCSYVFMILPERAPRTALMIGPYLTQELTEQQLLEEAERNGVPARDFAQLLRRYSNIAALKDESFLFAMVNAFAQRVWGSAEAYFIVDINQDLAPGFIPLNGARELSAANEMALSMQTMERRYAYENELIRTVSQGMLHRAEQMLSNMSQLNFERRSGDPVRNMKNYCIICNTLMRKAAEQGGVHPVYLDSVSSDFARRIELSRTVEGVQQMMREMVQSYCRLVKKHSMRNYSSVVQRAITYIDADLSADLSLRTLAAAQNINASYLSSLFKKETGETITEHVNKKRIEHAVHLLQSSKLQVQSIAQHCGISDVNYFSKLFKKHMGMTPREYRATVSDGL